MNGPAWLMDYDVEEPNHRLFVKPERHAMLNGHVEEPEPLLGTLLVLDHAPRIVGNT